MCVVCLGGLIGIKYFSECDASSGFDALVCQAVASVNALQLALVLDDASERVEARCGTTNFAPDRAT